MATANAFEHIKASDAPAGGDDLTEGLMLVRATSLKLIRLQLAMERQDRRAALETIDDLVDLDRHLQERLASLGTTSLGAVLNSALEVERTTLNHEKLALMAGITGKREPLIANSSDEPNGAVTDFQGSVSSLQHHSREPDYQEAADAYRSYSSSQWRSGGWAKWLLLCLALAVVGTIVAAFLLGRSTPSELWQASWNSLGYPGPDAAERPPSVAE